MNIFRKKRGVKVGRAMDFKQKEVVNMTDGKRLGFVTDVEIDLSTGEIKAIVVPGPNRILGLFGGTGDIVIPWNHIKKIGDDIILVDI